MQERILLPNLNLSVLEHFWTKQTETNSHLSNDCSLTLTS